MPEPFVGNAVNSVAQLQQRITCNRGGSRSFAQFVLDILNPREDDSVLDIGCGLGAQLIPVAERVRRIVGLDVSAEMVAALRSRIEQQPKAEIVERDMDDLPDGIGGRFTLAYAVYSLYYSRDPGRVVKNVAGLLNGSRARFVTVHPDAGNNAEWFEDLDQLYEVPAVIRHVPELCRRAILPALLDTFRTVTPTSYRDHVRFASLDALMAYYDACAPYCRPDKRDEALRHFSAKLERDGGYQITKCSVALVGSL
jgi:SAM-dependent methyltransferase